MMMCAIGYRRRRIVTISCTTAPTSEVTTPIFRGYAGSGRFRAASNKPSAASFLRVFWYAAQNAPTPAGVAALTINLTDTLRWNTSTSPETTTSMPSSRSNPSISASSRKRVHESCAVASFSVKNTWPDGARCRLLTSPRTRIRERMGFARTVSRITRASWVTVRACGAPGRSSQVTAMGSISLSNTHKVGGINRRRGDSRKCFRGHSRLGTASDAVETRGGNRPSPNDQFTRPKQCVKADADLREEDGAALLSVHDAHAVLDDRTMLPQPIDRAAQGAAGRHDILDEQHEIASVQLALEIVLRAMLLGSLPHDDVRRVAREAHGRGDRDRPEFDARDPARAADERSHRLRDRPQQVRPCDGPLDIHVIRRGLAGRQCERPELKGAARLQRG